MRVIWRPDVWVVSPGLVFAGIRPRSEATSVQALRG
jgi:hypothetical protein